jgi:hypothetical protein
MIADLDNALVLDGADYPFRSDHQINGRLRDMCPAMLSLSESLTQNSWSTFFAI